MRRKIAGIASLISFEAVARHQNFSRAAEDLALTQGAISRQVGALESVGSHKTCSYSHYLQSLL